MAKRKVVRKVRHHRKKASHPGYHPEHIAMMYRLGGGGIVILGGIALVFLAKVVFAL